MQIISLHALSELVTQGLSVLASFVPIICTEYYLMACLHFVQGVSITIQDNIGDAENHECIARTKDCKLMDEKIM